MLRASTNGTIDRIDINQLKADLPGAVSLSATGRLNQPLDSIARNGHLSLDAQTARLNFLLGLAGMKLSLIHI